MRSLKKNVQELHYALFDGKTEEIDENGDYTGNYATGYSQPVVFYANISPAKGDSEDMVFGKSLDYSKTISTTDMDLEISETSRIWFETEPVLKEDGTADGDSADYEVVAVAKGLNGVVYAIKALPKG